MKVYFCQHREEQASRLEILTNVWDGYVSTYQHVLFFSVCS